MNGWSLMIFAAGLGTRMGALTRETPKPMLPLAGRPLIDHAVELGRAAGVGRIVANTHYLRDRIAPHLAALGVAESRETPCILDTGGGLRAAADMLSSPTFTLNPDVAWEGPNPLAVLGDAWHEDMAALLLVVPSARAEARAGGGDFMLSGGRLARGGDWVYTGAQIIRTECLRDVPDAVFSLNRVWDALAREGALCGVEYPGVWFDAGTPEGLARAETALGGGDV